MNIDDALIDQYYGSGRLRERIFAGLELVGKDVNSLKVDDLVPIDGFHIRGRKATVEVAGLAKVKSSDLVLDVGCGMGGTARYLAAQFGCKVAGIDLTDEYIEVGRELIQLVGLSDQVDLRQGSALEIPYEDNWFDVVWTEHVQMNVADKKRFYSEIARVLKPGCPLLFHDIFRGSGDSPLYPMPWAEDESISALATETEARSTIEQVGLEIDQWLRKDRESILFFEKVSAHIDAHGPSPLGIHLLMGDNAKVKLANLVRNLNENRLSVSIGMAHKK